MTAFVPLLAFVFLTFAQAKIISGNLAINGNDTTAGNPISRTAFPPPNTGASLSSPSRRPPFFWGSSELSYCSGVPADFRMDAGGTERFVCSP